MNKEDFNNLIELIEGKKEHNPKRESDSSFQRNEQEHDTFKGRKFEAITTGDLQNENRERDIYYNKKRILKIFRKQLCKKRQINLASRCALIQFLNIFCTHQIGTMILLIWICFLQGTKGDLYSCPTSSETIQKVDSCPQNLTEWDFAAKKKRCDDIQQNCTTKENFQYHCLLNSDEKTLVEVCAPEKFIIGGYCPGYDNRGFLIIEMYYSKCNCSTRYSSTKAFEHQECYLLNKQGNTSSGNEIVHNRTCLTGCILLPEETMQNGGSNENIAEIIIITTLFLILAICVVVFLALCLKRRRRRRTKICKGMNGEARKEEGDGSNTLKLLASTS